MDWSSEKSIRDHLTAKKVELAILRLLASRKSRIFYLQVETVEKVDSGMAALIVVHMSTAYVGPSYFCFHVWTDNSLLVIEENATAF